ncbi:MAG: 4Fe-4S binding protein [Pirellulaceae bacterium]|nr:4Fe-4S binding protein [Pirellulaceae bacterium]
MMLAPNTTRKVIRVDKTFVGPAEPRKRTVCSKRLSDYPSVSKAHLDAAKTLSSPLLMGPPICDELIAFIEHTFTEDEAEMVEYLSAIRGRTAAQIARRARRPLDDIEPILDRLAFEKRAIGCEETDGKRRYRLMPIMPGIFEMVLVGESPETLSDWHRRFAELFEALFETGYSVDYQDRQSPFIRFLPVGRITGGHPMALPSDQLEVILDRYDAFGLGHCQCRMSTPPTGVGCGRPLEVCTIFGQWAEQGIQAGCLKQVSRKNVLEIKREAESHGLVTWVINIESTKGQASCSCCGCCCKAMRAVTEFNAPGIMAPPHFMPKFDETSCKHCGSCAKACPMGAITLDRQQKILQHQPARCIGCGLCQLACEKQKAIEMQTVPEYRVPYKSWFSMLLRNAPSMLRTSWKVWRQR